MFRKLKHQFGAKSKKAVALLAMAALLCGFTGCGKNETGSSAPLSSSNVPQSVPNDKSDVPQSPEINSGNNSVTSASQSTNVEESKNPQSSEGNYDNSGLSDTQSKQNATTLIKPEIVMDGQLISLPCKVKDIAGITIDREYSFVVVPASEDVDTYSSACFYYNNVRAGLIRLAGDCSERADLGEETVVGVDLFDDIPGAYLDLTFNSKREDVIDMLGDPDVGGPIMTYYINGNPADHIDFYFNSTGKIKAIRIYLGLA